MGEPNKVQKSMLKMDIRFFIDYRVAMLSNLYSTVYNSSYKN